MKKSMLFLIVVPFALWGENLAQLIELSKNNKMLDSSRITLESTKDLYESVKKGYLPQFNIGASLKKNSKELSTAPDNSLALQGSVDYVIYDGGKRGNTYDYYDATIKSGKESLDDLKNQIALQVISYYYSNLSYVAQKEAKLQEIEQLEAQYRRLKKFLDAGTTTEDEVQKIISNIQTAKVALHELELNIETINHNLEYVVGKSVSIESGSKISRYDSKESKLRADIKAIEYQLNALLANAKATKSGALPKVTFNDTLSRMDSNYDSNVYSTANDEFNQNTASLNLTWKIFDFGSTNKEYESAYKKYFSLKSQYEYEKNKANVDLRLALRAYDIGKLKIESAQAGLKAADSAYESIKAKYEAGLVDNVSYLAALSEKFDAESLLKVALYDLELKRANKIYYSGENLEEFVK
ncbi:MAG: TolC family protein [Arcobacter sp.]|nr:MAG: TolC family protein [Arcobacter sp.]